MWILEAPRICPTAFLSWEKRRWRRDINASVFTWTGDSTLMLSIRRDRADFTSQGRLGPLVFTAKCFISFKSVVESAIPSVIIKLLLYIPAYSYDL